MSALAALAAGAIVAVAVAGTIGSGGSSPGGSVRDQQAAVAKTASTRRPAASAKPAHTAGSTQTQTQTHTQTSQTQTVTLTPAAATTSPPAAATSETRGHQLMLDGNYAAAIPVLRQAVADASPSSTTYAYALYDLGRSLRLAGDPRQAVQVLYQRLQIPDQTDVVRQELQLALVALGQQAGGGASPGNGSGPASPPGPPGPPSHHHPGGDPPALPPGPAQGGPGGGAQGD